MDDKTLLHQKQSIACLLASEVQTWVKADGSADFQIGTPGRRPALQNAEK
jgi:hypothetical protein